MSDGRKLRSEESGMRYHLNFLKKMNFEGLAAFHWIDIGTFSYRLLRKTGLMQMKLANYFFLVYDWEWGVFLWRSLGPVPRSG